MKPMASLPNFFNNAHNLVSRNNWQSIAGEIPLDDMEVGAANRTGPYPNQEFSWAGDWARYFS
jgi:hypothetical protein